MEPAKRIVLAFCFLFTFRPGLSRPRSPTPSSGRLETHALLARVCILQSFLGKQMLLCASAEHGKRGCYMGLLSLLSLGFVGVYPSDHLLRISLEP